MNEIRFRASEDKILELAMLRRKSHAMLTHTQCTKCGSYSYVLPNMLDSCECERCYIERLCRDGLQCTLGDLREFEVIGLTWKNL